MNRQTGEAGAAPRVDALLQMLAARPDDSRALFGLAIEYERLGRWEDVATTLERYLELAADEGNAYGRLARALNHLGRIDEARDAYRRGVDVALRNGHPSMAAEFEDALDELQG